MLNEPLRRTWSDLSGSNVADKKATTNTVLKPYCGKASICIKFWKKSAMFFGHEASKKHNHYRQQKIPSTPAYIWHLARTPLSPRHLLRPSCPRKYTGFMDVFSCACDPNDTFTITRAWLPLNHVHILTIEAKTGAQPLPARFCATAACQDHPSLCGHVASLRQTSVRLCASIPHCRAPRTLQN